MTRHALLLLPFVLVACSKSSSAPTDAATGAAAPSASAAASTSDTTCPTGSSGKATPEEPCKGGPARVITAKWTGKNKTSSVFSLKNLTPLPVQFEQVSVYYYDAAGKQLSVPVKWNPKYPAESWSGSGGEFSIGPNETKEVELGWDVKEIPKGTKTIEAEINKIGWMPSNGKEEMYWENDAITPEKRAPGG